MPDIETEFLFEARVKLDPATIDIGAGQEGYRTIYLVKGGRFEGPALRGDVVADSGGDWVRRLDLADGRGRRRSSRVRREMTAVFLKTRQLAQTPVACCSR